MILPVRAYLAASSNRPVQRPFFFAPDFVIAPPGAFHALHLSLALTSLGPLHLSENSKNRKIKIRDPFQSVKSALTSSSSSDARPAPFFLPFPFQIRRLVAEQHTALGTRPVRQPTHEPSASADGPLTLAYRPRSLARPLSLSPLFLARIAFSSCGSKSLLFRCCLCCHFGPMSFYRPYGLHFFVDFWSRRAAELRSSAAGRARVCGWEWVCNCVGAAVCSYLTALAPCHRSALTRVECPRPASPPSSTTTIQLAPPRRYRSPAFPSIQLRFCPFSSSSACCYDLERLLLHRPLNPTFHFIGFCNTPTYFGLSSPGS